MRFWFKTVAIVVSARKSFPLPCTSDPLGIEYTWIQVVDDDSCRASVGCPPGIMNVILAAERSPCDEFDDYGDHLDWRFCAFRALDNGCILVVTQSKWRWWVTKMVDSNEVHQWRWIIWGVWVHLCILVYTINHSSRSCWASADSSRWILVNPGQAKPSSSSKAMLQPIPNTHLPKKPTRSTQHRQEERTTACLIQASGIPSIFTLVATLIAASVSVCPVKSNAAATCAKAWRIWRAWRGPHKLDIKWQNHPWDDALKSRHFFHFPGGGGLVGKIVDFGDFLQMLLREYALLWWLKHYHCYSSVWCIASNDIHYLKWSRKVQLFNWFLSKGNLDNVFQFETTWGLEIWWAATNVGWEFCLSWIIGDLSGSVQKKCSIYQMLTIQTIDHCWHKRFALHDSQDILALISGQNRGA